MLVIGLAALVVMNGSCLGTQAGFSLAKTEVGHELKTPDGRTVLQYMTAKPEGSNLTANSTSCLYPVFTPSGTRVVDFAPADHRHHRGVFLAWHFIAGETNADFWGWGKFAPTEGRLIRTKSVELSETDAGKAVIDVANEWIAEGELLIDEALTITVREDRGAYTIDLRYVLTPQRDLTLGQTAFGGFCVKSRKAESAYTSPDGTVTLARPHHLKPETDWPSQPWYDYTFELDGIKAGITVVDHPDNPETVWHNMKPIGMINPCIAATSAVDLPAKKPLELRYRLVVHDGPPLADVIDEAQRDFREPEGNH